MEIVVFGTGTYYERYKSYIDIKNIKCFVDNSVDKSDIVIDGKKVYLPSQVDYSGVSYVLILIHKYDLVLEQLQALNVPREKIVTYKELWKVCDFDKYVKCKGQVITFSEWCDIHNKRKILLVSHYLQRSGVPVAMLNQALLLRKMGYDVLYASLEGGELEYEIHQNAIDYIDCLEIYYRDPAFLKILKNFDFIFLGSLVLNEVVESVISLKVPILWWLNESEQEFYDLYKISETISKYSHIRYLAGGTRVINSFKRNYPSKEIEKYLYYLPDLKEDNIQVKKEQITFAMIGTFCKRKGQDLLLRAIKGVELGNSKLLFIGKNRNGKGALLNDFENCSNIEIIEEVTQDELEKVFLDIDVLICPSRDDPMPIVVTQAMQNGIPCIVSSEVGQSEYMEGNMGGYVFESENIEQLRECINSCLNNEMELDRKGIEAKSIFQKYFSKTNAYENMRRILDGVL